METWPHRERGDAWQRGPCPEAPTEGRRGDSHTAWPVLLWLRQCFWGWTPGSEDSLPPKGWAPAAHLRSACWLRSAPASLEEDPAGREEAAFPGVCCLPRICKAGGVGWGAPGVCVPGGLRPGPLGPHRLLLRRPANHQPMSEGPGSLFRNDSC